MRIVFMGTPDFAVPCLARLLEDGHELAGVFTQPDKPKGRGYKLAPPPVKELALAKGLPVFQPEKMKDGTAFAMLQKLAPELIVVVAYGRILPKEILALPVYGCVNVHGSLLPRWRGAAPIQWSVIDGDTQGGVTTMYMAEGLDCGDMIYSEATPIGETETSGELYERLAQIGARLLSKTVWEIAAKTAPRIPQDETYVTRAPMLSKEMAVIDFEKPAHVVCRFINGMNPWPVAQTTLGGRTFKIHRSKVTDGGGEPGRVIASKNGLIVACGEGAILLLELQAEGARKMPASDYLRGHPIEPGVVFGK